jgi:CRISPR/Cas system-associated endonuclease Cas1
MKERVSMLFIERGQIDVLDSAFVVIDKTGVRAQIPVGSIACLMLEPGMRVSHRAVALAAREPREPERTVRLSCRDLFRQEKLLGRIIPTIEEILAAGGLDTPKPPRRRSQSRNSQS